MTPPIIDRPERQGSARRTVYGVVTAIAWIAYMYLWLPLITLLAWALGLRTVYERLYLEQQAIDPFLLLSLPVIAIVCGVVLVGWAEYNRARFQRRNRRQVSGNVPADAVAQALGADPAVAAVLRGGGIVRVTLDEQARPIAAQRHDAPVP